VIANAVSDKAPILKQDLQVSVWLHTHGSPVFTAFLLAITDVHSPLGMTIMSCLLAYMLWHSGHRYWMLSLALAVPGGLLINTIIKLTFNRARPVWEDPILTLSSASFPSGHAAGATLFYGFIAAYMVWNMTGPWRRVIAIYLGVHYLSDVLAAVSMSIVWLVACLLAVRAIAHHRGMA
jgi:undecaprenyl-diphosphatase